MENENKNDRVKKVLKMLREYEDYIEDKEKLEEVIEILQDYDDMQNMDEIERYKKEIEKYKKEIEKYKMAYRSNEIAECINILLDIGISGGNNFKRQFLLSNALISPFSSKFDKNEYDKAMQIFSNALEKVKNLNGDKKYIRTLEEFLHYTEVFYENNEANTKRLYESRLLDLSLSKQLRMICIFLQDQSRLMREEINSTIQRKSRITGMEAETTFTKSTYVPNCQSSISDGYEATLESYNVLIQYLYYRGKKELEKSEVEDHGDIYPYELSDFRDLTNIAYQRMMYLKLEEKFRYSNWKITYGINEYDVPTYLFEPSDIKSRVANEVAVRRRGKQFQDKVLVPHQYPKDYTQGFRALTNRIDIDSFRLDQIRKEEYGRAKELFAPVRKAVRTECKPYYLQCDIGGVSVDDLLDGYEFLNTISKIYITACLKKFRQNNYSCYKYLAPIIDLRELVESFAYLYGLEVEKSEKILSEFVYDEKTSKYNGDIFTCPLIRINSTKIIFCQTMIETMNMNRNIEMALQRNKVKINEVGVEFEQYIIGQLKYNKYIRVNTKKIVFEAYDEKQVEFDFIGVMDDYLILMECKSLLTPYDAKELSDRRKTIHKAVGQVLRRAEIVRHDWDKIVQQASIELPSEPYPEDRIIKIVCTDIYDFTTLVMDGVRITDDSVLLKYLNNPFIRKFHLNNRKSVMESQKNLWKNGRPTPQEFMEYLDRPDAVSIFSECIHEHQKPVIYYKEQSCVVFKDMFLDQDPFEERTENQVMRNKIYPNDKCPCGSGKKYKKCCGKNREDT